MVVPAIDLDLVLSLESRSDKNRKGGTWKAGTYAGSLPATAGAADRIPAMTLAAGEVFAGYTIVRQICGGGMGEVYLAQHPRLPRRDAAAA